MFFHRPYCKLDLLNRTLVFYNQMADRFKNQLAASNRLMVHHFKARWNIDDDLYQRAIENQRTYLAAILGGSKEDPRNRLRRSRIVEMVKLKYA